MNDDKQVKSLFDEAHKAVSSEQACKNLLKKRIRQTDMEYEKIKDKLKVVFYEWSKVFVINALLYAVTNFILWPVIMEKAALKMAGTWALNYTFFELFFLIFHGALTLSLYIIPLVLLVEIFTMDICCDIPQEGREV